MPFNTTAPVDRSGTQAHALVPLQNSLVTPSSPTLAPLRQAQYHRREISNIVQRHRELLNAPEATYVAKDRGAPWRLQQTKQDAEAALHGEETEELDQEEL